ncbi:MAG: hypothetical protein L7G92_05385 [Stygiolobus sp.]|nr:hypothetical protein [Stygiolobus sp.]
MKVGKEDQCYPVIKAKADKYGPTTMSMVAMWDSIPISGISAGGIYYRDYNAIDVMLTRLMAG